MVVVVVVVPAVVTTGGAVATAAVVVLFAPVVVGSGVGPVVVGAVEGSTAPQQSPGQMLATVAPAHTLCVFRFFTHKVTHKSSFTTQNFSNFSILQSHFLFEIC